MSEINALLILPRLRVQAANAVSGPFTWGFPSPTAFTGFVHALERRLHDELPEGFGGVGIVCHHFDPQVSGAPSAFTRAFSLTRNPVDKSGSTAALVEEGKVHIEVSLLIGVKDWISEDDRDYFAKRISRTAFSMRLAGGSLLPQRAGDRFAPRLEMWPDDGEGQREQFRRLRRQFLPGFALTLREDKLRHCLERLRQSQPSATAMDALLDISRLNVEPPMENDAQGSTSWSVRRHEGWLVPLPIGYAGLSSLHAPGEVLNARDPDIPFRFVESIYSVGEWVSPHRIECLEQMLWYYYGEAEQGIYRCINRFTDFLVESKDDAR